MQSENDLEKDKDAVLAVLRAETDAWLRRDLVALSSHWLHAPYARRMSSVAYHGAQVQEGWDAIFAALSDMAVQFPQTFAESRVRWEGMNIIVNGDTAWATYDQVGEKTEDEFEMVGTQHELKIFHRVGGQWKLVSIVVMQRTIDHEVCPMIEITKDKTVLWMNAQAHEQINTHPLLFIHNSKLRARERYAEASLQKAVEWAKGQLHWHISQPTSSRPAQPVILGDSSSGAPVYCWVLLEDGKIMVSFNDLQLLKRRIAVAQTIYGLTDAQVKLAEQLAQGHELVIAANNLNVSINTVRTHLQRMFDRTGVRSQSALVGCLLSAEAPTA